MRRAVPIALALGVAGAWAQTFLFGVVVAAVAIAAHVAGEAFRARTGRPVVRLPAAVALAGAGVLAFVLVVLLA